MYTFFLYLSAVEDGGETRFTRLNISVTPRKGSAVVWPSVMSDDPGVQEREHGLLHWRAVTMDPAAIKRKCGLEIVDVSARLVKF